MGIIRDTCSFFRSIFDGCRDLKPQERLEIYETIFEYMFYDKEPNEVKPTTRLAFMGSRIAFDKAKERYDNIVENGKKGAEYGYLGAEYGSLGGRGKKKTPENPRGGFSEPPKTPQEKEREIEKEVEVEREVDIGVIEESVRGVAANAAPQTPKPRFQKPTLDEVKAYCAERKNNVDAERFLDFYESKGWVVGKTPMKDWRAAVRTWEHGEKSTSPKKQGGGMYDTLREVLGERIDEPNGDG